MFQQKQLKISFYESLKDVESFKNSSTNVCVLSEYTKSALRVRCKKISTAKLQIECLSVSSIQNVYF